MSDMLVKLENGLPVEWPVSAVRIRFENPTVSFPDDAAKIDISKYGYGKFKFADHQSYDPEYEDISEVAPVPVGGVYVQTWEVSQKFNDAERVAYDEKKASDLIVSLAASVRSKRDRLLSETDYLALVDTTLIPEMTAYRQALRDITARANFPHLNEADWPVKPV